MKFEDRFRVKRRPAVVMDRRQVDARRVRVKQLERRGPPRNLHEVPDHERSAERCSSVQLPCLGVQYFYARSKTLDLDATQGGKP